MNPALSVRPAHRQKESRQSRQRSFAGRRPSHQKLHLPNCTLIIGYPLPPGSSAAIDHGIHFRHVGLIVDNRAADFDPRVGFERQLLDSDHQLRSCHRVGLSRQTVAADRPAPAQNFFPVPDRSHVHGRHDATHSVGRRRLAVDRAIANPAVETRKIASFAETHCRRNIAEGSNTPSGQETTSHHTPASHLEMQLIAK